MRKTAKMTFYERVKRRSTAGFSLIEIVVVIAIMAVLLVVLSPSLLANVERSRLQKDESAMDEVVHAVQLALSDSDAYDEMLRYSCDNNYITYTDSSGSYGSKIHDEEFWAPDGSGKATTITFNPQIDGFGKTKYTMDTAIVNDMTYGNGSSGETRTMVGTKLENNQCYLKNTCAKDDTKTGYVYNQIRQTIGESIELTSQTYENSSFTIFIKWDYVNGTAVPNVYGYFNGTNLTDDCPASVGSGTSYDENNELISKTPEGGLSATPVFNQSDLAGNGSVTPDYKIPTLMFGKPYSAFVDALGWVLSIEFYDDGTYALFVEGCKDDEGSGTYTREENDIYLYSMDTTCVLLDGGQQLKFADLGITAVLEEDRLPIFGEEYSYTEDGATMSVVFYADGHIDLWDNGDVANKTSSPKNYVTYSNGRVFVTDNPSTSGRISNDQKSVSAYWAAQDDAIPKFTYSTCDVYVFIDKWTATYSNTVITQVIKLWSSGTMEIYNDGGHGGTLNVTIDENNTIFVSGTNIGTISEDKKQIYLNDTFIPDGRSYELLEGDNVEFEAIISGNNDHLMDFNSTTENVIVEPTFIGDDGFTYKVVALGGNMFYRSNSLQSVVIPDGVVAIKNSMFYNCENLTSVTMPQSLCYIGSSAFQGCTKLDNVIIPNGVTTIGENAFGGCELTNLVLSQNLTTIGEQAFGGCNLTNIFIPTSVTEIGQLAFSDCVNLTNVTLPSSLLTINYYTFYRCESLTDIVIPYGVETIRAHAFAESGLTSVTIPTTVKSIEVDAFNCPITDVYYEGTQEQWDAISVGDYNGPFLNANIHFSISE